MHPGKNNAILTIDTRPEYKAIYHSLSSIDTSHNSLRQQVFFGFNETDYQAPFDPYEGTYRYKPRTDQELGFDVTAQNIDAIREACEATLATRGLRGVQQYKKSSSPSIPIFLEKPP